MMKLPKIEPKKAAAGAIIALVALGAFALGTYRSARSTGAPADSHENSDTMAKGAKKQHADSEDDRKPASEDSEPKGLEPDDDSEYDEEDDVQIAHPETAQEKKRGIVDVYVDAWNSVNDKVRAIYRAEEDNRRLKLENAYLRVMVEGQKYSCRTEEAKKATDVVGQKLQAQNGSKAARTIASIRYVRPENLPNDQLHALGVSYFKVKDDEKSAVIFNYLTELEEDATYRTPENFLMEGVSLYRLENYKSAEEIFEKISKMEAKDAASIKAKRQAAYWRALVAERLRDGKRAQKIILESLESDPHTKEARWVNPKGIGTPEGKGKRVPAAATPAENHDKDSPYEEQDASPHR
jgi:hypothetical protein